MTKESCHFTCSSLQHRVSGTTKTIIMTYIMISLVYERIVVVLCSVISSLIMIEKCHVKCETGPEQLILNGRYGIMTSSNGNIFFRVCDPLCGELNGRPRISLTEAVKRSFDVFFDLRLNKRHCNWLTPRLDLRRNQPSYLSRLFLLLT